MSHHGAPCWYELSTADTQSSQGFYGPLLGWSFQDADMPGLSYTLAMADGDMVAGLMQPDTSMPEFWLVYFSVEDCDAAAARIKSLGGAIHLDPADIPGTGRFAIGVDPQGAAFGLLQPLPGGAGGAFDQNKRGHGNWHELHSSDPVAGLAFYSALLGWSPTTAVPMGEMGTYQLFAHNGTDIGGTMRLMGPPATPPHWLPYFGVASANAAKAAIEAAGGTIHHGPAEVPGGAFIVMAQDPRGTAFAVVGPP
jgi:predicted enzyme related to lactoylglutathione lyase